jgi:Flp pilus assembly protein TadD/peroxiredoxin
MRIRVSSRWLSRWAIVVLLLASPPVGNPTRAAADAQGKPGIPADSGYKPPALAVPDTMRPFLEQVPPGKDAFPLEAHATELEARLGELSEGLRGGRARVSAALTNLLAQEFRGAPLLPADEPAGNESPFQVQRAAALPADATLDARAFGGEVQRLTRDLREVTVAEFLITALAADGIDVPPSRLRTTIRYDLVGSGTTMHRVEHVGEWELTWQRTASRWQIVRWTALSHVVSRTKRPVFTEITDAALGGNESFHRQLSIPLDSWMATIDSVLTRDSNGHHGVSVGDVDGDGLDDLYVTQPAGLPNRLYRNRGDATFDDITDSAGLGVLDDSASSLFADVDNDGDEDLVLATATTPLLFSNDGHGRFTRAADAFQFARPPQGVLTSMSAADYDRDGYLDLYLCVYSYFFGAGEDKAGTPAPYYDARNGPPGILLRNDRHGHFVDATNAAGLDTGNDRYHFAAAWGDYDGDGWPDLLVANDFGTKNLYHNLGARNGGVTFEDVAPAAGVLDHGAGMSATFFDYDNDGRPDIYTGNMWSAPGQRVTSAPAFQPDATPEVRALYQRHVRGNSLFHNLGGGRFDDVTVPSRAAMGRWAWSSDAFDFDSDGWEDLYIVNGMLTRPGAAAAEPDLESFFWRQVVARSPLTRIPGTSYDEAWRAINQLLVHGSIASRQRNVFLRNDGHGGFDEVSGALGLDLDQDGRSFARLDLDRDGDEDLMLMAARQAPQLRIFRNDFATLTAGDTDRSRPAALAVRLAGVKSNRDAIGARVTVETDRMRRTKSVQAGSGFLSQHSKELIFGLGASERVVSLTVDWPSGGTQTFTSLPLDARVRIVEGGTPETAPFAAAPGAASTTTAVRGDAVPPSATWMYEPFPAPAFSLTDTGGVTRSLEALRGKPAVVLLWSPGVPSAAAALESLQRGEPALSRAGLGAIAIDMDPGRQAATAAASGRRPIPMIAATPEVGLSYSIAYRHLFMNRQPLQLPTWLLLDTAGRIVRVYRGGTDAAQLARDAGAIEIAPDSRLSRALPFAGSFYSALPQRNYLPYGRELLDQGLEPAAIAAFELAASASPGASTLYRLGTLLAKAGEIARARDAYEKALALQPDLAEASNDLGALLAQSGDIEGGIVRFRAALASTPDYPDALNNLGYALLLTGRDVEARGLYEKALSLQPDFPEALNNLGLLFGRAGDMDRAERYFRDALARRPAYSEAANNLALVLVSKGQADTAIALLEDTLKKTPAYESGYLTLARIHLRLGHTSEGVDALQRLLKQNPANAPAIELLRQWKRQ